MPSMTVCHRVQWDRHVQRRWRGHATLPTMLLVLLTSALLSMSACLVDRDGNTPGKTGNTELPGTGGCTFSSDLSLESLTGLRKLDLRGTQVTAAGLVHLKKALPNTGITR